MVTLKEIKAFRLSDGSVVEDFKEAVRQEKLIEFEKEVRKFVEKNADHYFSLTESDLYNLIMNRWFELKKLISILD